MEGSRRRDSSSLPVFADLNATQGYENELSRLESDINSNSSLTFENSRVRLHQIENSAKNCVTAWTDEKHDLYLHHLESSFVQQLHRSLLNRTSDSRVLRSHHRCAGTQHFLRSGKLQDSGNAMNLCMGNENILFNEAGVNAEQIFERRGKSLDYFGEFSDQNFTDEASEQKCVTTMSKRSKTIVS